jgi:hypothetical protein
MCAGIIALRIGAAKVVLPIWRASIRLAFGESLRMCGYGERRCSLRSTTKTMPGTLPSE